MFTDAQIEQMRRELENPELMQKRINEEKQANAFIEATKKRFLREGNAEHGGTLSASQSDGPRAR